MKKWWFFYILQSIKDTNYFYKGSTNDLERRLHQHNIGEVDSTRPHRPLRMVYYEAYTDEATARLRESSVKKSGSISVPLLRRIKDSLKNWNLRLHTGVGYRNILCRVKTYCSHREMDYTKA